jgi:L-seryl-tRNA(Ser) seleniumtransferase
VRARAQAVSAALAAMGVMTTVVDSESTVGGGAFPAARIPSAAVRIDGVAGANAEAALRGAATPVIGRVTDNALHLDLRSVPELHDDLIAASVAGALVRSPMTGAPGAGA